MSKELTIVQKTAKTTDNLVNQAYAFSIATAQDQIVCEEVLKGGKALKDNINQHYDSFLDPLKKQVAEKEAERKSIVSRIDVAIQMLKDKLTGWLDSERKRKEAAAAIADAEDELVLKKQQAQLVKKLVKEGKVEEAQAITEEVLPVQHNVVEATTTGEGIGSSSRLTFEIENIDKVPDFYFKPRELDTAKIRKAGYANKKISGIRFYRKPVISVKV